MKPISKRSIMPLAKMCSAILLLTVVTCLSTVNASLYAMKPPEVLFRESDLVVTGTVTKIESRYWNLLESNTIVTDVSLSIEGVAKGTAPGEGVVKFTYLGGRVGDEMMWVEEQPSFEIGEHVLMYLNAPETSSEPQTYTLTTHTIMGKSYAATNTTIGSDGKPVPIVPFRADRVYDSMNLLLFPLVALFFVTFFVIGWAGRYY